MRKVGTICLMFVALALLGAIVVRVVGRPPAASAAVEQTIVIAGDPTGDGDWITFAPPKPGSLDGVITSDEARAVYEKANPDFHPPADVTAQLGLYTAASGGDTYRYQDVLAWGYSWKGCPPPPAPIPVADASPAPTALSTETCVSWQFLDAHTGEQLEGVNQYGA